MTQRYRVGAIVFDLDGVLVDSMPIIRAYWTDWARRRGVDPQAVLASLHLTAEELVRRFAPTLDPATEARATAAGQAAMETSIVTFDGGRALLQRLPRRAWAVVTSARRELALRHLTVGNLPVPEVLVTAEDTPRGKPDPAGYRLAAQQLGLAPSRCVVIEDSPAGVAAARRAGMTVLAVTNSHPPTELGEADAIIDSLLSLRITLDPEASPADVIITLSSSAVPDRHV